MYSKMQKRRSAGWNGLMLVTPSAVSTTISPGSTSRMNSASMMSSAQVSDASTWLVPDAVSSLPSTIGRKPIGSRMPMTCSDDRAISE